MLTISKNNLHQTVITTFEVTPATCQAMLDELTDACDQFISKQPGFIGAAIHVNDARTRVANYSQWRTRDDFQAMLRSEQMIKRSQRINDLCKGFLPVMYDVEAAFN